MLLSLAAVGLALAALVRTSAGTCVSRPGGPTSLDLTPLLFFAVTAIALFFDLRAVRHGGAGARWGRAGLVAISTAAVLGIWTAGATLLGLSGCG